jgi:pimeloyl-ACP methyl ester carboxylesterase
MSAEAEAAATAKTGTANAASRPRARGRKIVGVFVAVALVGILAFVALVVASLLPTDLAKLAREHPPIEDRTGRASRAGCTLHEEKKDDGSCAPFPAVAAVREEQVTFPSSLPEKGLRTLRGTLSLPDGGVARPAIILVHGSGPNGRDEVAPGDLVSTVDPPIAVFKELAAFLSRQGFVVLRYDKRNCLRCYADDFDTSKLDLFRWSDLERDARDALAYLRTRPEVDAGALVVAGHSEGGQIAPFVAVGEPGVVAVMMLAGLTEPFTTGLLEQFDRFRDVRLHQGDVFGALNVYVVRRSFAACFAQLDGPHDPNNRCAGGGVTLAMLSDYGDYVARMPEVLRSETCPVFAIQGSVDRNINPLEMQKLAALLAGKDHELHYVPNVNHLLVNVVDGPKPPSIDAEVERRITAFLASVKR